MPPAKKAAKAAPRSRVMGGAEDEVVTNDTPEGANDPAVSSRDKDALFGDAPKNADGVRPGEVFDNVQASDLPDAPDPDPSPPVEHEHSAHESADAVEDDADYEAEEVEAQP